MTLESLVTYDVRDQVAFLGLNRPDQGNAIDDGVANALAIALSRASREARVGVIYGHGSHFCGGLDLNWLRQQMVGQQTSGSPRRRLPQRFDPGSAIENATIPFIAAIQGGAIGLGVELAAAMHIRIADESAFFALPEVRHGLFVGGGGAVRISRLIGVARMQDMMLTGRRCTAGEALQFNLVQYVAPSGSALQKATEVAEAIKKGAAQSTFAILKALPRINQMSPDDGYFWESIVTETMLGPESHGRISQFLDAENGKSAPQLYEISK